MTISKQMSDAAIDATEIAVGTKDGTRKFIAERLHLALQGELAAAMAEIESLRPDAEAWRAQKARNAERMKAKRQKKEAASG